MEGPSLAPGPPEVGGQPPAGPCAPLRELPPTSATHRKARGQEQSHATSCRGALPTIKLRRASDERLPAVERGFFAAYPFRHVPGRGLCVGQRHD
jgi:hypothetical protein